MAGKTIAKNGSRRKKTRKNTGSLKWVLLLLALLVALAAVSYLYLCMLVDQEEILEPVTVGEVSLQGMTLEEAEGVIQARFGQEYQNRSVDILLEGETYTVVPWDESRNLLSIDVSDQLQDAMKLGHGALLTRGWDWIQAQLMPAINQVTITPQLTDREGLSQAIAETGIASVNTAVETSYTLDEDNLLITKGTAGVVADVETLTSQVEELINSGTWVNQNQIDCATLTSDIAALDLQTIYDEVYTQPQDATLDKENDYAIVDSVDGVSFDLEAAQAALDSAQPGEQVTVPLVYTEPEVTTAFLEEHLFADRLGSYSTNVSGSSGRKSNVRLSAEFCDGTILLPGETFSYNDTVGQRTTARGFSEAPAYSNGQTVQEVGGGICQTSSTLYAACLYANLEITQRTNHSYASSYIGLGMDATVSWGGPDYQFTNNTKYPIKVVGDYSGGTLTMSIYGTKTDDITVKITSETLETISWSTKTEHDSSLADGESKVITTPYTGYKVQTYRKLYDGDGNLISSEPEAYSNYRKRDKVIAVG